MIADEQVEVVQASKKKQRSLFYRGVRWLFRLSVLFAVLLLLLRGLLNIAYIQNKIVTWAADYLSETAGTRVEVEGVNFQFFDVFELQGVYIEDYHADTLLYVERLRADVQFFSLLDKKIVVEKIRFKNTRFNLHRYPTEYFTELGNLLNKLLAPPEPGPPSNPALIFKCKTIRFDGLRFGYQDAYNGDKMLMNVATLTFDLNSGDFSRKILAVRSIVLTSPKVQLAKAPRHELDTTKIPKRNPADTIQYPIDSTLAQNWTISVGSFELRNGSFNFDDLKFQNYFNLPFDPRHFDFDNINLQMEDFLLKNKKATAKIIKSNVRERRGFEVSSFTADVMVRVDTLAFFDMKLVTPESYLGDTLIFAYSYISDMGYFNDAVRLDMRSESSVIAIQDLLVFAPQLQRNAFFRQNKNEKIILRGRIYDRVNRLKGDDLYLSLGKSATAKGSFRSRNLTNPDETLLQLNIDRLNTNMRNVALLFPDLKMDERFFSLGNINFKGKFDGFYYDFVADGSLRTDLGRAEMSINFKSPTDLRQYSGRLDLFDFNLGKWANNPDFGTVTFRSKMRGTGSTLQNLNLNLDAKIESFVYKNYPYEQIAIDGVFKQKSFIGKMGITDGNIDLNFNGEVNFNGKLPIFDLTSEISHLDLQSLNITKEPFILGANLRLNFIGDDLDNLIGQGSVRNLNIETRGEKFALDSLVLRSKINENERSIRLNSEVLTATLDGNFAIKNIQQPILNFLVTNYPAFARKLDIPYDSLYAVSERAGTERFALNVEVEHSKNLTLLLDERLDTLEDISLRANFNAAKNSLDFDLRTPVLHFDNTTFYGIYLHSDGISSTGTVAIEIEETNIGNLKIPKIILENSLKRDTISFATSVASITDIFSSVNINGELFLENDQFLVHLDASDLFIAKEKWAISDNNYIKFGSGYINTNNFTLKNGEQTISLNSIGDKGLQLDILNLPMTGLEAFFTIPFLKLGGTLAASVSVENIFQVSEDTIIGAVFIDSTFINNDFFGTLEIAAKLPNFNNSMEFELDLINNVPIETDSIAFLEAQTLHIQGKYKLPVGGGSAVGFDAPNSFNFRAEARNFPFRVAEYFIPGISETKGSINAALIFTGNKDNPKAMGNLRLTNAGTKVDYLQTFYGLDNVNIIARDGRFDLSGNQLKDKFGNTAYVSGGINHTKLKDFVLDLRVTSPQFLLIDTKKENNELFYGRGIGAASVEFSGPLSAPNIAINATTAANSWMSIPLTGASNAKAVNFIQFVSPKDTVEKKDKPIKILGVNIDLELNVTPQADISLIFDESVGDVMRGRGKGNLKISLTNTGGFNMFGTYELTSGEYLFTYNNSLVNINKPFIVRNGGTITWDGSPYTAQIKIDAVYKGLRTSVYNLLLEYLTLDEEVVLAQRATDVELTMSLSGDLMKPEIDFDIQFPNLNQRLLPFMDNKMRLVRADKNELNRQVFGLVVLKSFLPSEGASAGVSTIFDTYVNTFSEMLSNQLSLYVTGLVSEIVTDVDFLSGVDFDFNYQRFTDVAVANPNDFTGITSEFQVSTQSRLLDNKVIVGVGGGVENSVANGTYFTGDFVLEYIISDDGRLRIKGYRRTEPDISSVRNKTGVGVSYSIEFDSLRRKPK